jgi:transcriptional regulator with XRE-family HTH domain
LTFLVGSFQKGFNVFGDMDFGGLVRGMRERRRLTQEELAQLIGETQPWVSRLEGRRSSSGWLLVERVAKVLGMQVRVRVVDMREGGGDELVREAGEIVLPLLEEGEGDDG